MSSCIKDLYDYDLIKKCSKCGIISLKSNFHRNKNMNDGLSPHCKICKNHYNKNYYVANQDRLLNKQKLYNKENRDKINTWRSKYIKNRIKTDVNFRLIRNTRRRILQALQGKTKSSSTKDILGIDIGIYKKWIEYQMTPEMNWSNIEIDHVKAICLFDVTRDEQLKEAFNWRNTQPLLKEIHRQKGIKFNVLDYQNQFIKAYQFLKLNNHEG